MKFVHCDVTNWNDQVNLFRTAASMTPSNTIDHVVANAGIAIEDEVFSYDGIPPSPESHTHQPSLTRTKQAPNTHPNPQTSKQST
jgi:NAD(P)-dependent dehydrogenase (short-subunit alcohol dehydrogenase family)